MRGSRGRVLLASVEALLTGIDLPPAPPLSWVRALPLRARACRDFDHEGSKGLSFSQTSQVPGPSQAGRRLGGGKGPLLGDPPRRTRNSKFFIRCSTAIMLELRSLLYQKTPYQKTLLPAYRVGVMFRNNWLAFKTEDSYDTLI